MVFTRSKLLVSVDNAAAQEDIDRWPHLRGVEIAKIDAKIGLLIGCDAPEALAPKEINQAVTAALTRLELYSVGS